MELLQGVSNSEEDGTSGSLSALPVLAAEDGGPKTLGAEGKRTGSEGWLPVWVEPGKKAFVTYSTTHL